MTSNTNWPNKAADLFDFEKKNNQVVKPNYETVEGNIEILKVIKATHNKSQFDQSDYKLLKNILNELNVPSLWYGWDNQKVIQYIKTNENPPECVKNFFDKFKKNYNEKKKNQNDTFPWHQGGGCGLVFLQILGFILTLAPCIVAGVVDLGMITTGFDPVFMNIICMMAVVRPSNVTQIMIIDPQEVRRGGNKTNKQYIQMKDSSLHRLVRKNESGIRYIRLNGSNLYLSKIRGKYTLMNK